MYYLLILVPFIISLFFSFFKEEKAWFKIVNNIISILILLGALYFGYQLFLNKDYRGLEGLVSVADIFMIFAFLSLLALQRFFIIYLKSIKNYTYVLVIKLLFGYLFMFIFLFKLVSMISTFFSGVVLILALISLMGIFILSLIQ